MNYIFKRKFIIIIIFETISNSSILLNLLDNINTFIFSYVIKNRNILFKYTSFY